MKRRDFMKLLGGALGAVTLTSCSGGGDTTAEAPIAPIPNGYTFYKLVSSGDPLPGGNTLSTIPGTVMVNDANEVYFYGLDQTGTNGFYELGIDYGGSRPVVQYARKVVREGDVLNDSKVVTQINTGDMNDMGSFAAVIQTSDNLTGAYLEREKGGFEPVATLRTPLPGGGGMFGGIFGDVDIHNDNNMMLVAHFTPNDSAQGHQGVFHLPGGEINQSGQIVASTRDQIPDANGYLTGIGLIDLHDNGNYVMQAFGAPPVQLNQVAKPTGMLHAIASSLLITGNVRSPSSKAVLSSSPVLKVTRKSTALVGSVVGEVVYGPRIGAANNVAYIVHVDNDRQVLRYVGKQVVAVGSVTPLGATIISLSAPVIGRDGLLYYQAVTDQGVELMVYNGPELMTILSKDDVVGGSVLNSFFAGFMPDQVDSAGRIVLTGDFADGSTSLLIGIPM